jgi:hypothetical protein
MENYVNIGSLDNKNDRTVSIRGDCCGNLSDNDLKVLQQEMMNTAGTMVHLKVWNGVYKDTSRPRAPPMIFMKVQTIEGAEKILQCSGFAWGNKSVRIGGRSRSQSNWGASAYFESHPVARDKEVERNPKPVIKGESLRNCNVQGGTQKEMLNNTVRVVAQIGSRVNALNANVGKFKRGLKRVEVNQNKSSTELSYIAKHITDALKQKKAGDKEEEIGEEEGAISVEEVEDEGDDNVMFEESPRKKAKSYK